MTQPLDVEAARVARDAARGDADLAGTEMVYGAALFEAARLDDALEAFVRAEQAYGRAGLSPEAGMSRLNRARALSALGRDGDAVALYEAVASGGAAPGAADLVGLALHGLCEHHERLAAAGRADDALRRLREHTAATGDPVRLAALDHTLATRLVARGEYDEGLTWLDRARAGYLTVGDRATLAHCDLLEGWARLASGRRPEAVAAYTRAVLAFDAVGDRDAADAARASLASAQAG